MPVPFRGRAHRQKSTGIKPLVTIVNMTSRSYIVSRSKDMTLQLQCMKYLM